MPSEKTLRLPVRRSIIEKNAGPAPGNFHGRNWIC